MTKKTAVIVSERGRFGFAWSVFVNGREVATSGKAYPRRRAAWRAYDRLAARLGKGVSKLDALITAKGPRFVPRKER